MCLCCLCESLIIPSGSVNTGDWLGAVGEVAGGSSTKGKRRISRTPPDHKRRSDSEEPRGFGGSLISTLSWYFTCARRPPGVVVISEFWCFCFFFEKAKKDSAARVNQPTKKKKMSGSLANRDEALRCAEMAEAVAQSGNLPKAIRLFEKAFSMYPDPSIAKRLKAAQDSMASPNNPSSSSSSSSSSSRANPGGPQPAPSSSSSSSSTAQPAPRQRTGGQGAAAAAAASAAPPHTPQRKAAVVRVIQAKTHYEVLEVTKEEADDANLKKAYRKVNFYKFLINFLLNNN
jgi:hypothetical protein